MTKLSVNVNKLATLRNSRGKNNPDVLAFARNILTWGAHGITVHPRPDGRHIRRTDVVELAQLVREVRQAQPTIEFNVEGYPSPDFLALIEQVQPDQATLVPDPPEALTSNAGWALNQNTPLLNDVIAQLRKMKVRTSLFVDPFAFDSSEQMALKQLAPERIELYTEAYAEAFATPKQQEVTNVYVDAAVATLKMGIQINAGHDLNQQNLGYLLTQIPQIEEVSIGHALVCEALLEGMPTTIGNYLKIVSSSGLK